MWVEALVEQRPERGNGNRTEDDGVHVEDRRGQARLGAEQQPLHQEQRCARRKDDRNNARRPETPKQPSRDLCGEYGENRCTGHEVRKALYREVRKEQPIADRVSSNLLRDERSRGDGRGKRNLLLAHGTSLPICPSSRVARALASSYS